MQLSGTAPKIVLRQGIILFVLGLSGYALKNNMTEGCEETCKNYTCFPQLIILEYYTRP